MYITEAKAKRVNSISLNPFAIHAGVADRIISIENDSKILFAPIVRGETVVIRLSKRGELMIKRVVA